MTFLYFGDAMQVGIDLVGPLPITSRGNKYIVTLIGGLFFKMAQG